MCILIIHANYTCAFVIRINITSLSTLELKFKIDQLSKKYGKSKCQSNRPTYISLS